jgi:hypothetical protein
MTFKIGPQNNSFHVGQVRLCYLAKNTFIDIDDETANEADEMGGMVQDFTQASGTTCPRFTKPPSIS